MFRISDPRKHEKRFIEDYLACLKDLRDNWPNKEDKFGDFPFYAGEMIFYDRAVKVDGLYEKLKQVREEFMRQSRQP